MAQNSEWISVPQIYHPFIRGVEDCNVKVIGRMFPGVSVQFSPPCDVTGRIVIQGSERLVTGVVALIHELWEELVRARVSLDAKVAQLDAGICVTPYSPGAGGDGAAPATPFGRWNAKPRVQSSTINQVFVLRTLDIGY